jgi:hypothetical protein
MRESLDFYRQRHGDIFTLFLIRKRLTFITHAADVSFLSKLEKKNIISNFPTRFEMMPMLFGDGVCRRHVVEKYWTGNGPTRIWTMFQGSNITPLTLTFQKELESRIASLTDQWHEGYLLEWIATLFLPVTSMLFYGKTTFFASPEFVNVLMVFNSHMNALYKGKHPNAIVEFVQSKRRLIQGILETPKSAPFNAVAALQEGMHEADFTDNEKATTLLSILWASNMNVIISAFWVVVHVFNTPEALQAIHAEIGGRAMFTVDDLQQMPVIESVCLEAMRLSTANILRTEALQDFAFETHNSASTYRIRKGDNLVLSTGHIHRDPKFFPSPEAFIYDRFLGEEGAKQKSKLFVFAHGQHKCPGRFLAMNELKLLVLFLLTKLDLKLKSSGTPLVDFSFFGVGAMKPVRDVAIQYRKR